MVTLCNDNNNIASGDENHPCGASLRESHKISLKAHRHACVHGVGAPIARPEKLPRHHRLLRSTIASPPILQYILIVVHTIYFNSSPHVMTMSPSRSVARA